jgi:hypothetical protein
MTSPCQTFFVIAERGQHFSTELLQYLTLRIQQELGLVSLVSGLHINIYIIKGKLIS